MQLNSLAPILISATAKSFRNFGYCPLLCGCCSLDNSFTWGFRARATAWRAMRGRERSGASRPFLCLVDGRFARRPAMGRGAIVHSIAPVHWPRPSFCCRGSKAKPAAPSIPTSIACRFCRDHRHAQPGRSRTANGFWCHVKSGGFEG
jgi:hypothetical protein